MTLPAAQKHIALLEDKPLINIASDQGSCSLYRSGLAKEKSYKIE